MNRPEFTPHGPLATHPTYRASARCARPRRGRRARGRTGQVSVHGSNTVAGVRDCASVPVEQGLRPRGTLSIDHIYIYTLKRSFIIDVRLVSFVFDYRITIITRVLVYNTSTSEVYRPGARPSPVRRAT